MSPALPRTGLVESPHSQAHDTGPGHPENAGRLRAIDTKLRETGLIDELDRACAPRAPLEALLRVHSPDYVERVRERIEAGADFVDSPDVNVCPASFESALHAAGGALLALDNVVAGTWKNAFVAARPPGHHAEASLAMGFCLFNNAATVVRQAQALHGLERVAVLDWDVHHGNGTQHLFERDESVFYASLHEFPHYPGTGRARERGFGAGEGATLNCPMDARSGDADWLSVFDDEVLPALDAFRPQLLVISAGFDAHLRDPLSSTRLSEDAFKQMTRGAIDLARRHCGGKVVSLLEGGYDPAALAASVHVHLTELQADSGVPQV
ncbi:MAG: acetoin utilization deacetylase AcuC-like enzyme [Chlamydiales bacterium]|jgi:acetoin utilization deacetylase AcuC-like enzyme